MAAERTNREKYFQTIARFVLTQRRSSLLLTPHEIYLIDRWLSQEIPLRVVLDGLQRAVDYWQVKKKPRRSFSLVKVERFVLAAYQAYRERQLGKSRRGLSSKKTGGSPVKLRQIIAPFVHPHQKRLTTLGPYFREALAVLNQDEVDEAGLEEIDEKIDRQLVMLATAEEREQVMAELQATLSIKSKQKMKELVDRALAKYLRHKFKIPYCSPYLY